GRRGRGRPGRQVHGRAREPDGRGGLLARELSPGELPQAGVRLRRLRAGLPHRLRGPGALCRPRFRPGRAGPAQRIPAGPRQLPPRMGGCPRGHARGLAPGRTRASRRRRRRRPLIHPRSPTRQGPRSRGPFFSGRFQLRAVPAFRTASTPPHRPSGPGWAGGAGAGHRSSGTLGKLAISLRSSFWFVPALIVLASVALAAGMVARGRALDGAPGERWPALFASDADGARELLAIIAGSMITVAGVVFSITIAALAQAASQYTSRVLRNFMRDRGNQAVLGVFLGVFAYCLVVMHAITPDSQQGFVPLVAVVVGLLLSLVAVAFLVFFIHHVAAEVQSGQVARSIALETLHTMDELLPEPLAEGGD